MPKAESLLPKKNKKIRETREKLGRSDVTRREKQKLAVFVFVRVPRSSAEKKWKGERRAKLDVLARATANKKLRGYECHAVARNS